MHISHLGSAVASMLPVDSMVMGSLLHQRGFEKLTWIPRFTSLSWTLEKVLGNKDGCYVNENITSSSASWSIKIYDYDCLSICLNVWGRSIYCYILKILYYLFFVSRLLFKNPVFLNSFIHCFQIPRP